MGNTVFTECTKRHVKVFEVAIIRFISTFSFDGTKYVEFDCPDCTDTHESIIHEDYQMDRTKQLEELKSYRDLLKKEMAQLQRELDLISTTISDHRFKYGV